MPSIAPNQTIEQSSAELRISNKLPVGKHRFELVVIDDAGQASDPASVTVTILEPATDGRFDLRDRLRPDLRDRLRDPIIPTPPIRR